VRDIDKTNEESRALDSSRFIRFIRLLKIHRDSSDDSKVLIVSSPSSPKYLKNIGHFYSFFGCSRLKLIVLYVPYCTLKSIEHVRRARHLTPENTEPPFDPDREWIRSLHFQPSQLKYLLTLINFRLDIFANLIRYCLSFPYDDDDDEQCCLPFHPTPSSRTDASSWLHSRYVRDCVPLGSLSITLHAALRANKYPHNHT
jgi:hypothetical protein